jgi:ubiquinol-cytochrome c reductase iron-sulfur subunit
MSSEHSTELDRPGAVADPVPDPGLEPHQPRLTDIDPKAARRAERQVATMFGVAALCVVASMVAYVALPLDGDLSRILASNTAIGLSLGLALFLIGAGAVQWAKKLMPDVEIVQERHPMRADAETRTATIDAWQTGLAESGFGRRPLIRRSLLGAMLLLPLPAVVLLRDLGPLPRDYRAHTIWREGVRVLQDVTFEPIRPSDLDIGQLVNAMPATYEDLPEGHERLAARATAPVILVRMTPDDINAAEGRENWDVDGILAYSKICTHVGCPISLYEQQTHNLFCPCHQSTFNLADNGRVIFGPAARDLPQLPLAVDDEGYLVAQSDFTEPVGPSYWERG